MAKFLALTLLLTLTYHAACGQTKCGTNKNRDCPQYTAVQVAPDTEARTFTSPTTWMSTSTMFPAGNENALARRARGMGMFMSLLRYIKGDNLAGQKIAMTIPVTRKIVPLSTGERQVTMSFYMTSPNPPAPLNAELFSNTFPQGKKIYVRSFTTVGRAGLQVRRQQLAQLQSDLTQAGLNFDQSFHYQVGLTPPWEEVKKHEIWVEAL